MQFTKAERKKARLRLALSGPSGSGKTYSALLIAKGIGGKIAVIDTEHESASLYAGVDGMPEYDTMSLQAPYEPERFVAAIKAAEAAGYNVLIIDSATHEWSGSGGCLEINERLAGAKYRGNTWSAWNETTPRHDKFVNAILMSPMHIIVTMRSKTETVQNEGQNGKKQVVKLGMKAQQREGSEYEYTTVLDIAHDSHLAMASKDRTGLFGSDPQPITEATGARLLAWLDSGAEDNSAAMRAAAIEAMRKTIASAPTMQALREAWGQVPTDMQPDLEKDKDTRKTELTPKPVEKAQ